MSESHIQLAATICAAVAAYLSYKQCKLMRDQLDGDRYLRQNEKSLELAKLFADRIIPMSSLVTSAVKRSETFAELAKKTKGLDVVGFDQEEFTAIFGDAPQRYIEKIGHEIDCHPLRSERPSDAHEKQDGRRSGENGKERQQESATPVDGRESQPRIPESIEFENTVTSLLNCLEYFSMAFNAGVADDEALYPSLHQIFFSTVDSLYVFICRANDGDMTNRYYTHITDLYAKWQNRYREEKGLVKQVEREVRAKYEQKKKSQLR